MFLLFCCPVTWHCDFSVPHNVFTSRRAVYSQTRFCMIFPEEMFKKIFSHPDVYHISHIFTGHGWHGGWSYGHSMGGGGEKDSRHFPIILCFFNVKFKILCKLTHPPLPSEGSRLQIVYWKTSYQDLHVIVWTFKVKVIFPRQTKLLF